MSKSRRLTSTFFPTTLWTQSWRWLLWMILYSSKSFDSCIHQANKSYKLLQKSHRPSLSRRCLIRQRTTSLFIPRIFSTKDFFRLKKISMILGNLSSWRRNRVLSQRLYEYIRRIESFKATLHFCISALVNSLTSAQLVRQGTQWEYRKFIWTNSFWIRLDLRIELAER